MNPISAADLRAAFVNCSKREATAVVLPELDAVAWEDLDFLAWRNPRMPQRAYVACWVGDRLVAMVFRAATRRAGDGAMRTSMCEFCHTVHSAGGVTLFTANKSGTAGRRGDSVGTYFCADLDCCLYVRDKKRPKRVQPQSTMTVDERIERLTEKLHGIVSRVLEPTST
ncbi:MAG TPA: FBP domain-containing protein [Stackebrandtia sp.]|uniref:FBP domain-containing protein n=1 Tax=Stackebrandtia sp. TaxID=2023065 RepID=UPI002D57A54D|nr:FBP domain-containing protein [Stackebrandtia sp.]HZE38309.1 FBP domain-containing protein [Stackebrandtia sp.]